jgi:hypothetical protein
MNESHLDPDIHLWPLVEDHGYDALMTALKGWDTGRWDWDGIDCCLTGKYADLDPHGQQGIRIESVTEDKITFTAHIGKTFCGEPHFDISEDEISDEDYEHLREYFLDVAQEIVCDCCVAGDWSGDDWYLYESVEGSIEPFYDNDDEFDAEVNAQDIVMEAGKLLEDIEEAFIRADKQIDELFDDILKNWKAILNRIKGAS